jgi:hypothetical protein
VKAIMAEKNISQAEAKPCTQRWSLMVHATAKPRS